MKRKVILLVAFMVISIGLFVGCTEESGNIFNPTNVDIVSKSSRTGYEGFNFVVYIDVSVYNRGGDGKAIVWA